MPVKTVEQVAQSRLRSFHPQSDQATAEVDLNEEQIGGFHSFVEGFKRENPYASYYISKERKEVFESEYTGSQAEVNPFDLEQRHLEGYLDHADEFVGVENMKDLNLKKYLIDLEREDEEDITGWAGAFGRLTGAILDTTTFIPFAGITGKALKAGTRARRWLMAEEFAGTAAVQEGMLHDSQVTRSEAISVAQVAFAGVLGRGIGQLVYRIPVTNKRVIDEVVEGAQDELDARTLNLDTPHVDAGGMAVRPARSAEDTELAGGWFKKMRLNSRKIVDSSPLSTARETQELLEATPLYTKGNFKGKPTSEGRGNLNAGIQIRMSEIVIKVDDWHKTVNKLVRPVTGKLKGVSKPEVFRRVTKVRKTGIPDEFAEINKIADDFARTMDDLGKEAEEAGLIGGDTGVDVLDNYVTLIARRDVLGARKEEFVQSVADKIIREGGDADYARITAEEYADNLLGTGKGFSKTRAAAAHPGVFKDRTLGHLVTNDSRFDAFFVTEADDVLTAYVKEVIPHLELREMGVRGKSLVDDKYDDIVEEGNQLIAKGELTQPQLDKVIKTLRAEEDAIMLRRFDGESGVRTAANIKKLLYVEYMGMITVAAVPDLAKQTMEHALIIPFRKLSDFLRAGTDKTFKDMTTKQLKDFVVASELAVNSGYGTRAAAFLDEDYLPDASTLQKGITRMEEGLDKFVEIQNKTNGMNLWNYDMKGRSALKTIDEIVLASDAIVKGTAKKDQITELAQMGLGADTAKRIIKALKTQGKGHRKQLEEARQAIRNADVEGRQKAEAARTQLEETKVKIEETKKKLADAESTVGKSVDNKTKSTGDKMNEEKQPLFNVGDVAQIDWNKVSQNTDYIAKQTPQQKALVTRYTNQLKKLEEQAKELKGKAKPGQVDPALAGRVKELEEQIAKDLESELPSYKGRYVVDINEWDDKQAARLFKQAVWGRYNTTIVTPSPGDRMLFAQRSPTASVALALKSFLFATQDRTLWRTVQRFMLMNKKTQIAAGTMAALLYSDLANKARDELYFRSGKRDERIEKDIKGPERFYRALDRSGLIPYVEMLNIARTVAPQIIPFQSNRQHYWNKPWETAVSGPAGSLGNDMLGVVLDGAVGDWEEAWEGAKDVAPLNNNITWLIGSSIYNEIMNDE